ncbi:asparagine synthetase B [Lentzea pudingi]|uniref:asparagine synthase (glutamine-hydrolyzing) n=1 Tax=Lentzea pudingi TaxID=1789439 RepID=A0ABQ2HRF9_9PSEU|nr:asparagine synthetase B [Lentzea pudingi]
MFGMNLLAVVSTGVECGPYTDHASGVMLTFNGEVYNYRELAARWSVPLDRATTDAHVILRGYLLHGADFLTQLVGMFALAVHDPRTSQVLLARDRFGEKPLYYQANRDALHFASEIKALAALAPVSPRVPDSFWALETTTGSATLFDGAELLEPGTFLVFDLRTGSGRVTRYWAPESVEHDGADVRAALDTALERTRPSEPFALMLSGGLDSAVLAATMRPDVLVTVGYPGEDRLDETADARLVADSLGIPLVTVLPTAADFAARAEEIVRALDHPVGNASLLSEFMLYERVAEMGLRVVVGGTGPDELLLGYVRHAILLDGPLGDGAAGLESYAPLRDKFKRHSMSRRSAAERYYRLILRGPDVDGSVRRLVHGVFAGAPDVARALSITDLLTAFPPLMLTSDKLSSHFGLERRSPYLDHEFAECCYALPLTRKRTPLLGLKAVLREVAADVGVPRSIWEAVDKRGFASPVPFWLDNELAAWSRTWTGGRNQQHDAGTGGGRYDRARMMAVLMGIWRHQWTSPTDVVKGEQYVAV